MPYVFINRRWLTGDQALVSVEDRGFRYGDGVFETIAVHGGIAYQWDLHIQRLKAGLAALRIPLETAWFESDCRELLRKNKIRDGYLRISVTRGPGGRGYLPPAASELHPTIVIESFPATPVDRDSVALWHSGYEKMSPRAVPVHFKTAQGLNATLARLEAQENGCFDGLMFGVHGQVCETGSANIFWFRDGVLYTPSIACGVLDGTTRAAIMRISPFPVREGVYALDALKQASAVFLTNVHLQVLGVQRLEPEGFRWESDALAEEMLVRLRQDIDEYANARAERAV